MPSLAELTKAVGVKFKRSNPDVVFDPLRKVDWIPSGNIIFDAVSGGGFPRRRITEVFGMEHSGKTAITLLMAGLAQQNKLVGVFMDHEHAWHASYAERTYKVIQDNETFSVFQPNNIEEGDTILDEIDKLMPKLDYIIFDSVDAMRPKAMIERSQADDSRIPGSHAYGMSQLIHKINKFARDKNCAVIFINQMRTAINTNKYEQAVGSGAGFNPTESFMTTGGHALRFYASLRMKLEYGGQITNEMGTNTVSGEQDKVRQGTKIKMINVKNKVSTPYLKGMSNFVFPTMDAVGGWQRGLDVLDLLKKRGHARQQATKFVYNGLEIKEWFSMGSKVSSEDKFCSNPALMADAEKLLFALQGKGELQRTVVSEAQVGTDFTSADTDDKYVATAAELAFVAAEDKPLAPIDDQLDPIEETSL